MNKIHKLLLKDYYKDTTEMRLNLFVSAVNPNFILNKKTIPLVKQLLEDYRLDPSNSRLKVLISHISTTTIHPNRLTPTQMKKLTPTEVKISADKTTKEKTEIDKKESQLLRLLQTNYGNNPAAQEKISNLREEIDNLRENNEARYAPASQERTWRDNVLGVFGHWDDEDSIAYKLINGTEARITIDTGMPLEPVIQALEYFSGNKNIHLNWYVQSNKGYGTQSVGFKEQAILTNRRSGLQPIKENGVSVDINSGQERESTVTQMVNSTHIPGTGFVLGVNYK